MLYKKRHEAKCEKFEGSMASFTFLGGLAFVMLLTGNAVIGMGIWALSAQQTTSFTCDAWANVGFLIAAVVGALLIDAQSLIAMFTRILPSEKADESSNAFVTLFGLHNWARTVSIITVTVNWLFAHGLMCSATKLLMQNPLDTSAVKMAPETLHDMVSGDLLMNPLIRTWNWEVVYGMMCGLHLSTFFAISVAHRASFNVGKLVPRAICHGVFGILLMALTGFFRVRSYAAGWIGPSDGFWLVLTHLVALYLAYDRWYQIHPTGNGAETPEGEFQEGILAFADKWRGWKPVSVFLWTTVLSVVFAHATPVYPLLLCLTYAYHWKSHRMDRGWNKILFFLTITHQILHYFVHSYRTLEDQPLLFVDKFTHFLYAVVAAQQFRENTELLSRDPLVRAFNYINIFVWIPGDVIAMYISGFHGPSEVYLKHMIGWGGYCLSTGTAMAYINNDVEEDNAEDSSRRFIGKGLTGHGIQIFEALLFAVLYIVGTGGSQEAGYKIEYLYDYAAHLYTGYGAM